MRDGSLDQGGVEQSRGPNFKKAQYPKQRELEKVWFPVFAVSLLSRWGGREVGEEGRGGEGGPGGAHDGPAIDNG